jgi:transposase
MGQGNFTEDFRLDAIKQILERGHSVADVSKRLGVGTHSLYGWMKRSAASPVVAVKDDQTAEISRLKQELARVTEEREIQPIFSLIAWYQSVMKSWHEELVASKECSGL